MLVEEFERIERAAPETVWLEFVRGRLVVKPGADGARGAILVHLVGEFLAERPESVLYPYRGLKVGAGREDRARPDGTLAPGGHFAGDGEWAEPDGVLMTVEVTSYDQDTGRRDRVEKRDAYAAAGIPVHLLVDRDDHSVTVHSEPEGGTYRSRTTRPYGAVVEIPDPVGITLRTEKLKDYA
ncbi:Uma2 family endonuclease [Streptomyces fenghuangensis]